MLEKIEQIQELLNIPNVDANTETAITNMKILNILVGLRSEIEQLNLPVVSRTLPDFLYESNDGIYFAYTEDADIKQEWEDYLKNI